MTIKTFLKTCDFDNLSQVEQAKFLIFYHLTTSLKDDFSKKELQEWFAALNISPNLTRLISALSQKRLIVAGTSKGSYKLAGKILRQLQEANLIKTVSEEIDCVGQLLPKSIYQDISRGFIKKIADQVNSTYEGNAFDACAVMMRRLMEMLIIHSYRAKKIDDRIKDTNNHYIDLDSIINKASTDKNLNLTAGTIKALKHCKDIGNLGAHDIIYTCKKDEIDKIQLDYRKVVAHLIDVAGFVSKP